MDKDLFELLLSKKAAEAEQIVLNYLPREQGVAKTLFSAMHYSVKSGGKRLRPLLMLETFRLFSDSGEESLHPFMAALEMIHTSSLIHDDLPALDNDDLRRGRKTNHIVYGEAVAVLAGDGLLNLAFETAAGALLKRGGILADAMNPTCLLGKEAELMGSSAVGEIPIERLSLALYVLSLKAGSRGMLAGQVADIEAERAGEDVTLSHIGFIHAHKTAALLQAALMIGGILGGADRGQVLALERLGGHLGIAFQIRDDILDVTGDTESLGKNVGSDEKNEKSTYVSLAGLDQAREDLEKLSGLAKEELEEFPGDHDFLAALFTWLMERNK